MTKLLIVVFTMLLAGSLAFAQGTTGSSGEQGKTKSAGEKGQTKIFESGKKATKTSKAHKGGKKGKKNSGSTTTPQPK